MPKKGPKIAAPVISQADLDVFRRDPGYWTVTASDGYRFKRRIKKTTDPRFKEDWLCVKDGCKAHIFVTGEWKTDAVGEYMHGAWVSRSHGGGRPHPLPRPLPPKVEPDVAANVPEAEEDEPDVAANVPEAEDDEPDVAANVPEAEEDAELEDELAAHLGDITTQADDSDVEEEALRLLSADEVAAMRVLNARVAERAKQTCRRGHRDIAVARQLPRGEPAPGEQFETAAEEGELEELQRIFQAHEKVLQAEDPKVKEKALHRAAHNNHVDVCKWLLKIGADPEWRTENGWTVLHRAARRANAQVVELMLSHGMSVNSLASGKLTPLHLAINSKEDPKLVKRTVQVLLGVKGIDLHAISTDGNTPLMLARGINAEMTKMIETRLSAT